MPESLPRGKRVSRFGRKGAASYFGFLIFVVGQFIIVFRSAFKNAGSNNTAAWGTVAWDIGILAGLILLLFAGSAIWRSAQTARERKLSIDRPGAIILTGVFSQVSRREIKRGDMSFVQGGEPYLPVAFTISSLITRASNSGLGGASIEKFYKTSWTAISAVSAQEIAERSRRSAGLLFTVHIGERTVQLPVIITGRGFARLFPEDITVLERVASDMSLRKAAGIDRCLLRSARLGAKERIGDRLRSAGREGSAASVTLASNPMGVNPPGAYDRA